MADTAAIQALLDAVPTSGGRVYLPAQTYVIDAPLRIGPATLLCGDGQATLLQAAPGATFPHILVNRDAQSRRSRIQQLRLSGNKASGAVCGGISWDHTGIAGAALHRIFDVRIEDCAQNGLTLTRCASVSVDGLLVEACGEHGVRIDGTSYDAHWTNLIVGNSGLHNIWTSAGGYFDGMHSYWSGMDGLYVDGWSVGGRAVGKIEDSFRHGLHFNALGLPNAWYGWHIHLSFSDIEEDVVRITNGHRIVLNAQAGGAVRHSANSILRMISGQQNHITICYATPMVSPNAPVQGSTAGNVVEVTAL